MTAPIDFRILGPLEVHAGGQQLQVTGPKRRAALAVLLLHAGELVSVDHLIDSLWGDRAPDTAVTAVYGHILALRKLLGRDAILTRAQGYVLDVDPRPRRRRADRAASDRGQTVSGRTAGGAARRGAVIVAGRTAR